LCLHPGAVTGPCLFRQPRPTLNGDARRFLITFGAWKIPLFKTLVDSAHRALSSARFELFTASKENTMNRRTRLALTTTILLCLPVGLSASNSLAQQKSLKEQLVGTWTLVSSDQVRPDGSILKQFGANPKGISVFDANGRLFSHGRECRQFEKRVQ
jgi:hypothetical protein